jgi:hypothetical protein
LADKTVVPPKVPCVDPPVPTSDAPPQRTRSAFASVIALFTSAVALGLIARATQPGWSAVVFRRLPLQTIDGWAACFVALVSSVALHECGHLAAALALRFEVTAMSLGPFRVSRLHGDWTLQVMWRRFFLASVSATPRSQSNWRANMLLVVAAGPFATGVAVLAAYLVAARLPVGAVDGFWDAALQMNLFFFLLGLIPSRAAALQANDARLFLVLLRFDEEARSILLYHLLTHFRLEGRRPRHYPEWVVRRLAVAEAGLPMQAAFAHAVADWALDCGDLPSAVAWTRRLGEITAACDPLLCYTALAHSACLDLILLNDSNGATQKLACVPEKFLSPKWFRYRSLAVQDLTRRGIREALGNLCRAEFYRPAARLPYFEYEQLLITLLRSFGRELSRSGAYPRSA